MARAADARHSPHGLPLAAHMLDYRPCATRQRVQPGTNLQLQGVATRAGDMFTLCNVRLSSQCRFLQDLWPGDTTAKAAIDIDIGISCGAQKRGMPADTPAMHCPAAVPRVSRHALPLESSASSGSVQTCG